MKMSVEDGHAFGRSLEKVLALPIQRIVPGHGEVLEKDAKGRAGRVFEKAGVLRGKHQINE